jgi:uncharacterized repeat protein (TIGR03803 family)
MKPRRVRLHAAALLFSLLIVSTALIAQAVSDVVTFDNTNFLANPGMTPTQAVDGKIYGVIYGYSNPGSIFDFSTTGAIKVIHALSDPLGYNPTDGLTLGTDGNFYGGTQNGGSGNWGVLFRVSPNGIYTVLHNFAGGSDGGGPTVTPIEATEGNIYGTTYGGCCLASTVYKYTPSGVFTTIYTFDHAHGVFANSLMQGSDGNLYATAEEGGIKDNGTIVKLTTSGQVLNYYAFRGQKYGAIPVGPLIEAPDGNYYGTTEMGGVTQGPGYGTIFRMTPDGEVRVIYIFCEQLGICADGFEPGSLVLATDGNLYGVTGRGGANSFGTLFRVTTSGEFTSLYSFTADVGETPVGLMQDTNGLLYGSAQFGGGDGYGAIYSLDMGLGPFITFVQPTGKVSHSAQILGQGLTGTTSVTFNGVPATSFSVKSETYMTAVLPGGATTGPVVVTTPSGVLTSNKAFRILK